MIVCHSDGSFVLLPRSSEGMSGAVSLSSSTGIAGQPKRGVLQLWKWKEDYVHTGHDI